MNYLNSPILIALLTCLFALSAFFAAAETGLMAANPYRLKHLAKTSLAAKAAERLLLYPERLLSVILIGNNFANISISVILTFLATHYFDGAEDLFFTVFHRLYRVVSTVTNTQADLLTVPVRPVKKVCTAVTWLCTIVHFFNVHYFLFPEVRDTAESSNRTPVNFCAKGFTGDTQTA